MMPFEDKILALPRLVHEGGTYVLLSDVLSLLAPGTPGKFTLYKVTCNTPHHYYVGVTRDVDHRFKKHRNGKGAVFTRRHGAQSVEVLGLFDDKWSATRAETAYVAGLSKQPGVVVGGAAKTDD